MNANSIGSVTPTKNAETELAKTKHKLVLIRLRSMIHRQSCCRYTKHHNWEKSCLVSASNSLIAFYHFEIYLCHLFQQYQTKIHC